MKKLAAVGGAELDTLRIVHTIQIHSVAGPFARQPGAGRRAATLLARAEVMGFSTGELAGGVLSVAVVHETVRALAAAGVASRAAVVFDDEHPDEAVALALEGTEHSPMPRGEWPALIEMLGEDLLAHLLGISASSLRRYATGTRPTPDAVAARLHLLALVVVDLAGAYNAYGIRRWFTRPRHALGGRAPLELLEGEWDPDGEAAASLRRLAGELSGELSASAAG